MLKLILRNLVYTVLICIAIVFFVHLGLLMAANFNLQGTPRPVSEVVTEALAQSGDYFVQLFQGNLGNTTGRYVRPVGEVVADAYPKSLGLLAVSLGIALVLGIAFGIISAIKRHSQLSLLVFVVTLLGISTPSFFAAVLIQIVAIRWYATTGNQLVPLGGFGWDIHIVMPALVLAARPVAQVARVTFVTLSEILEKDYIRTARAKGVREFWVLNKHALRNAAVPVLTALGVSLRFSLSSLPVVEFVFSWPGVGFMLLRAIGSGDLALATGLSLSIGITFMVIETLLELSYRIFDPRLREAQMGLVQAG
ncbi:MAG: ABC transporter permease [Chloroflexi bacterium]|nr:ABC transporter permease [Chloroflexota bacterium]MBU1747464.1 ABC transporter permease [Chloroflexota bacterium]